MLESLIKSRDQKNQEKVDDVLKKGLGLIKKSLYKQGMMELQNALHMDPMFTAERLEKELKRYRLTTDYEATLSVGLILLKVKKDDYKLANLLGNCARRQESYKQANNLYRYALKVNREYQMAFFNLAASMGKVEKYDTQVRDVIMKYVTTREYILPDRMLDEDVAKEIENDLRDQKKEEKEEKIQQIEHEREEKEASGEVLEVHRLTSDLLEAKAIKVDPVYEEISYTFKEVISEIKANSSEPNSLPEQEHLFDLGLYAYRSGDYQQAKECFEHLIEIGSKIEYLEMMIAIINDMTGETDDAANVFVNLLGKDRYNRYYNVNLGLLYRKADNRLLSIKYLVIGAVLLEKSDGLFSLKDLIALADDNVDNGKIQNALKLYAVVVGERDDIETWWKIGKIHLEAQRYIDATDAFKQILRIEPESTIANDQLQEIHDYYFERGEDYFKESKFKTAVDMYEKAMDIMKVPETVKHAASVYKVLGNKKKGAELMSEYFELQQQQKVEEQEAERVALIKKGIYFMKRQELYKAIQLFDTAFRMKMDKDVFMLLANIYKKMKKTTALQELLMRWNKMVEHEEKMKKFDNNQRGTNG
ncbi:MAG: hypothetical protein OEY59_12285 [Deltaproteobacteria bacterium]|nr:hypothetical protein [Deltaproteobacteria bacterium]